MEPIARLLYGLAAETGAELLKVLRAPQFVLPTLALPVAFYLLFAVVLPMGGGGAPAYLLATYGIFAMMGPTLFGFGAGVASEREQGWLNLKRVGPTPFATFVGAKLAATLLVSAVALMPIYAAAGFLADVALPRAAWLGLLASHLLAVLPFSLLGLAIGFALGANAAIAAANLAFLGLAVVGGLWFPVALFPGWLQGVAGVLPSHHLAAVSLAVVGAGGAGDPARHLLVIALTTVLLGALAAICWWRQR